jgi:hypothetical protein
MNGYVSGKRTEEWSMERKEVKAVGEAESTGTGTGTGRLAAEKVEVKVANVIFSAVETCTGLTVRRYFRV